MAGMSNLANVDKVYYADNGPGGTSVGNQSYYMSNNVTKYHYVGDVFRMDNISLSVGFIHPIYDPRKVRKARTKSVSRSILKKKGNGVK
jgi:hypothetical protein